MSAVYYKKKKEYMVRRQETMKQEYIKAKVLHIERETIK